MFGSSLPPVVCLIYVILLCVFTFLVLCCDVRFVFTSSCLSYLRYPIMCLYVPSSAIHNRQSRETGNIEYTRRRNTKKKRNTICGGHHYTQTNTNNINKTMTNRTSQHRTRNVKTHNRIRLIGSLPLKINIHLMAYKKKQTV
jgi:hypothetical protein